MTRAPVREPRVLAEGYKYRDIFRLSVNVLGALANIKAIREGLVSLLMERLSLRDEMKVE